MPGEEDEEGRDAGAVVAQAGQGQLPAAVSPCVSLGKWEFWLDKKEKSVQQGDCPSPSCCCLP